MEIRDLAPALLALGQAFDRANAILNGDKAAMSLEIRATQAGSFEVALLLKQLYDGGASAFSGDFITGAVNIKELFFGGLILGGTGGGTSLFSLIKRMRGRRIHEAIQDGQNRIVFTADNVRLEVPVDVFKLYNDGMLREQLGAVVRPLTREGIDSLLVKDDGREINSVNKAEAQFFRGPDIEYGDETTVIIPRQRLKPSTVNFIKKGKWKLSDGEKTRFYAMHDSAFLADMEEGRKRFGSKDLFVCEVLMKQSVSDSGELKTEYEITQVLDHITPESQQRLPDR